MDDKLSIVEWVNLSNKVSNLESANAKLEKALFLMAEYVVNSSAPEWEVESVIRFFKNKAETTKGE